MKDLIISITLFFSLLTTSIQAATFEVKNQCSYTVWAAASPGGGKKLDRDQTWMLDVPPGTTGARIWGRTNCKFDGNGNGNCETGNCPGGLQCTGYGAAPNTLAEFGLNQYMNLDFIDISVIDGFNIPMDFSPTTGGCRGIKCAADINGQCPNELKTSGGYCNNACPVFKREEYCCNNSPNCGPTNYSRFFKERCPDAYTYPKDPTSDFSCPGGTNYRIVFCP